MPRQQNVHGNVGLAQLVREIQRHRHHTRLGRLVWHLTTLRTPTVEAVGTDAHDTPAALLQHWLDERLDYAQGAEHVRFEHSVPVAHLGLERCHAAVRGIEIALTQSGVVDDRVDGAKALQRGGKTRLTCESMLISITSARTSGR